MTQFALAHPSLTVLTTLAVAGIFSWTAIYIAILKCAASLKQSEGKQ